MMSWLFVIIYYKLEVALDLASFVEVWMEMGGAYGPAHFLR